MIYRVSWVYSISVWALIDDLSCLLGMFYICVGVDI